MEGLAFSACIDQALAANPDLLRHTLSKKATTSTHSSIASEVLAQNVCMEHRDLLGLLRGKYHEVLGGHVLDFLPETEQGRRYLDQAVHLMDADCLQVIEMNEKQINNAHNMRLRIVVRLVRCVVHDMAERAHKHGVDIDLIALKAFLNKLVIVQDKTLSNGVFWVKPDQTFLWMMDDESQDGLCLSALEDKVSKGLGIGGQIDFDTAQDGVMPNKSTMHAMQRVYTQVALSDGTLGLLTGLQNGTWLYGHKEKPSSGNEKRILYSTKNLTPEGMPEVSRFKILLEAEILCLLHAVQDTEHGKFLQSHVELFPRSRVASPLPWFCSILNALLFMWMMVSILCLRITGPSLLRTRRINLYLWTLDRSVHQLHAEHKTNSRWGVPLLLKTGQELGQGAHGIVKAIHGMDLVVKIGSSHVIRHEAYFYQRARPYRGLPMVADFGAFNIDGSDGCALLLELARPVDEASVYAFLVFLSACYQPVRCVGTHMKFPRPKKTSPLGFAFTITIYPLPIW
ncbi:hypothetical protein EYR40_011125 [Pleurotus pulmonarius]|nr:hypothetical protein EYR40_011125 [Pleurotus pulmonarius]